MARAFGIVVSCLLVASQARAQTKEVEAKPAEQAKPAATQKPTEAQAAAPAGPERLEAVVRGLFVQMQVSGGYMVASQKLGPDPTFPGVEGKSEQLGPGAAMHMALGFDATDMFAIELIGGTALVSGGRTDRVRDLGMSYGGAALRLAFDTGERLDFVVQAGGAMARADNGVEKPTTGPAVFGALGFEYYVHIRHFSVGLDVTVLAPLDPMRVFVGLGPQLKYTF